MLRPAQLEPQFGNKQTAGQGMGSSSIKGQEGFGALRQA
jgi:hypothetical protein